MLFYGDEAGYTNDYSYLNDSGKSYDNRWMHRPLIDWGKNSKTHVSGTVENQVYSGTQRLLKIRKKLTVISDHKNLIWLTPHNDHIAGFLRHGTNSNVFCVFNFSNESTGLTWYAFKEKHIRPSVLFDHWSEQHFLVGNDHEYLQLNPYQFMILEVVS